MSQFFNEYGVPHSMFIIECEDAVRRHVSKMIDAIMTGGITPVELQAIERHAIMFVQGVFVERLMFMQNEIYWNKQKEKNHEIHTD